MGIMRRLVERMSAEKVHHVTAVPPAAATGLVATVYAQLRDEFLLVPPFTLHSPAPEILAGVWAVTRETLVCGEVPRGHKEAVASTVSRVNACSFCVDAHLMALQAAGGSAEVVAVERGEIDAISDPQVRALVRWASRTLVPGDPILAEPPFRPAEAPEIVGTALCFHYINRMVNVFCDPSPMPLPQTLRSLRGPMRRLTAPMMMRAAVTGRYAPGRGLDLIPRAEPLPDMPWATRRPAVAGALAGLAAVLERQAREAASPAVLELVGERLGRWHGEAPEIARGWVEAAVAPLADGDRIAARLALLVALASTRVDAAAVDAFRERAGDAAVVALSAWASFAAARRIGSWVRPAKGGFE
jgi:AhpD family alkylhydroperoxidase